MGVFLDNLVSIRLKSLMSDFLDDLVAFVVDDLVAFLKIINVVRAGVAFVVGQATAAAAAAAALHLLLRLQSSAYGGGGRLPAQRILVFLLEGVKGRSAAR